LAKPANPDRGLSRHTRGFWPLPGGVRTRYVGFEAVSLEFEALGTRPDLIAFEKDEKMVPFGAGLERQRKRGWDKVGSFSIKASRLGGGFITGWCVSAGYSAEAGYFFFCVGSDIAKSDDGYFISLARRTFDSIPFDYGMIYRRRLDLGADLYAVGLIAGLGHLKEKEAERRAIAKWMHAPDHFRERNDSYASHLRDVYEVNFLSPVHLTRPVDGTPLQEWVSSAPRRGVLKPFTGDRSVWKIEKSDVASVRERLIANSLLVAYQKDVPPFS